MKYLAALLIVLLVAALLLEKVSEEDDLDKMPVAEVEFTWLEDEQAYSVSDVDVISISNRRIVIPEEFNGFPVIKIVGGSFSNISGEMYIHIPDSIIEIGEGAFSKCKDIVSIEIPASVKKIGKGAFAYCENLEEISVEMDNMYYHSDGNCLIDTEKKELLIGCKNSIIPTNGEVIQIADEAFALSKICEITIPNTIRKIEKRVFYGTPLKKIICSSSIMYIAPNSFPENTIICAPEGSYAAKWAIENAYNVTYIDDYFDGEGIDEDICLETYNLSFFQMDDESYAIIGAHDNIENNVVLPKEYNGFPVTLIADNAFMFCDELDSVEFSTSIVSIGGGAFKSCSNLKKIFFSDSVRSIGMNAFFGCKNLTEIIMPDSIVDIEDYAFNSCINLEKVAVSSSVTRIGNGVFSDCKKLSEIEIPSSVTYIDNYAFFGCNKFIIYTEAGSYAESWGKDRGYEIKIIE